MNYQNVITLLFAGCCLFAVVSMAASLETTVPGTPDDVVDVDTESLPLPSEQADQVKHALQSSGQSDTQGDSGTTTQPSATGDQQGRESRAAADADAAPSRSESSDGAGDSTGETADSDGAASGLTKQAGLGPGGPVESLLDLLRWLFERLLVVLAGAVLLGAVALGVHKRDLLFDRLRAYLGGAENDDVRSAAQKVPARSPENEIERRWLEMVSRVEAADDPSLTPRERAEAVAQAGLRSEPVRELTDLFEDVRYGEKPVTSSEVREASAYLRRSTGQSDD